MRKPASGPPALPTLPYPVAATKILGDLRDRVSRSVGYRMTYRRLGKIIGKPTSTTHYWFETYEHPNLIAFFRLLERLSARDRHALLERYCREFPRLSDSERIQDQDDTSALLQLLSAKSGLTIVHGMTSYWRNFLVMGICASYAEANEGRKFAAGVDLEQCPRFVPPEFLVPLDRSKGAQAIRASILEMWPKLAASGSGLIVLNGICRYAPEIFNHLEPVAACKHIVVADQVVPAIRGSFPIRFVHLIQVSKKPKRVRVVLRKANR